MGWGGRRWPKTGPNDSYRHLGHRYLLFFACLFLLLTNVILGLIYEISREKAVLTKTGPNDSIAVIWVLCVFFFFLFLRLFLLTYHLLGPFLYKCPPTHSRATATPLLLPAPQQRCWSQPPPQSGFFFNIYYFKILFICLRGGLYPHDWHANVN